MGTLSDFNLTRMIADFGSRFLVETGTGSGKDAEFAADFAFEQVYSIEESQKRAIKVAFHNARRRNLTVLHSRNERGLKDVLNEIPIDAPVIYWLDSHPSPHDLECDLRLIATLRNIARDIFLIDDLRTYEAGDYDDGPASIDEMVPPARRNLAFVDEILGQTHLVNRLSQRTGYLCAFPQS
ncbi:hypothetical protein [Telmatospirillum sp.]|uniref:hypothetical protein n=1 Tax=Telmatospirillum sp. TaxID=2079197 RepID=UPI002848E253|nr:hypothetical protein [Telmatospirillum sp.]MDR3441306.1 hypothetical protein [Telmatospirillum sp.]